MNMYTNEQLDEIAQRHVNVVIEIEAILDKHSFKINREDMSVYDKEVGNIGFYIKEKFWK